MTAEGEGRRNILAKLFFGFSVYTLVWVNVFVPALRVAPPGLNDALFSLAQAIPAWILGTGVFALDSLREDQKETWCTSTSSADAWFAITVGALLLIPAVPIGMLEFVSAAMSADGAVELKQTVASHAGTVRVYRTDGGATTAVGIIVQQECAIGPGIRLVRRLAHEYPADVADVTIDDRGLARIAIQNGEHRPPAIVVRTVPLRRFCWGPSR